jgi:hypothetical protein
MKYFLVIGGILAFVIALGWDINAWLLYSDGKVKMAPSQLRRWESISVPFILLGAYLLSKGLVKKKQPTKIKLKK